MAHGASKMNYRLDYRKEIIVVFWFINKTKNAKFSTVKVLSSRLEQIMSIEKVLYV